MSNISINYLTTNIFRPQVFVAISSIFLGVVYPISSGSFPPSPQGWPVENPEAQLHHEGFWELKLHTSGESFHEALGEVNLKKPQENIYPPGN